MAYHLNTQTGQLEDENGNPAPPGAIPMDQMAPAGGAPTSFAANQRAGVDLSQPLNVGGMPASGMPEPVGAQVPQPMPEPPPVEKPQSMRQTTVTREVPTKLEKGLVGQIQTDADKASALARQEGEIATRKAGVEATGAQANFESAQATQDAVAAEQEKRNAVIQAAQAKVEADRAKYESEKQNLAKMDIKDMYEGRPGALIAKAIALALGTFGSALSHSPNAAAEIISANENAWYKLQEAKINKQKEAVGEARGAIALSQQGFEAARQSKSDAMGDLRLQAAARADTIAMKVQADAARIGTEGAALQGEKIAQTAQQIAHQHLLQYQEGLRTKVVSETQTKEGGPSGSGAAGGRAFGRASDLALFGTEVDKNVSTMDSLGLSHAEKIDALKKVAQNQVGLKRIEHDTSLTGAAVTMAGRAMGAVPYSHISGLSEKQKLWIAANDVAEKKTSALLEKSTAPSAQHSSLERIAINPDDSPASMEQKLEERRRIARETIAMAGSVGQTAQRAAGGAGVAPGQPFTAGQSPAPMAPKSGVRKMVNGKPAIVHPDGSYDYL